MFIYQIIPHVAMNKCGDDLQRAVPAKPERQSRGSSPRSTEQTGTQFHPFGDPRKVTTRKPAFIHQEPYFASFRTPRPRLRTFLYRKVEYFAPYLLNSIINLPPTKWHLNPTPTKIKIKTSRAPPATNQPCPRRWTSPASTPVRSPSSSPASSKYPTTRT